MCRRWPPSSRTQPWRSPVYTQVVEVQAPLTPRPVSAVVPVELGPGGPTPAAVTIAVGESVAWSVPQDFVPSLLERMQLIDNPTVHLRSDTSPLSSTDGWDSGLLAPGSTFSRTFPTPGEYTYQDGLGHTGKVTVQGERRLFLPFLSRE